jgi:hypothetical protein
MLLPGNIFYFGHIDSCFFILRFLLFHISGFLKD